MRDGLLIKVNYGLSSDKIIYNCNLLCRDGKIHSIGGNNVFDEFEYNKIIDLPNCYVAPGFIDSHIYGFAGYDVMDHINNNSIFHISKFLAKYGVTSFCPTMHSTSLEQEVILLKSLSDSIKNDNFIGAEPCGLHMIGPFINSDFRGANPLIGTRNKVDILELEEIFKAASNTIKIMTFAPELEGTATLVDLLHQKNITPSMGYSNADEKNVQQMINNGVVRCTHLYNAMGNVHQRNVGLATTTLTNENISAELIIDGYHVHPQMLKLAFLAKKNTKIIAVSGASHGSNLPDGHYSFSTTDLNIKDQHSLLEDGTIAGSMITLNQAWKNILSFTTLKDTEAIKAFTLNPAINLNLNDRGKLHPGLLADLVIMDKNHNVQATLKKGELIYSADSNLIKDCSL